MATGVGRARAVLLRADGHRAGVEPVRMVIEECVRRGIEALTLFAFSSENWGRPRDEVMSLMSAVRRSLEAEIAELHQRGVRVRFIGEREELAARLRASMRQLRARSRANTGPAVLQIALSYGGRGDIVGAARRLAGRSNAAELRPPTSTSALRRGAGARRDRRSGPVHPHRR
jgi:undecaprenyl diphosphate synthase